MEDATSCYICGHELNESEDLDWITLGAIEDKFSADFAKETLASYEIPAVILSKSGFFGNIGLPLNPFYKTGTALFEVMVPKEFIQEASDILDMTLGEKWQRKDK